LLATLVGSISRGARHCLQRLRDGFIVLLNEGRGGGNAIRLLFFLQFLFDHKLKFLSWLLAQSFTGQLRQDYFRGYQEV
jgi:hypothetical protein